MSQASVDPNAKTEKFEQPPLSHSRRMAARHGRRRYVAAAIILVMAVGAGMVIGASCALIYFKHKRFTPPKSAEFAKEITARMRDVLKITPEESDRLEAIISRRMEDARAIRREMSGKMREQFAGMADEIDAVLGPERAAKWDKDFKERTGRDRRPPPRDAKGQHDKGPDDRDD